MEEKYVKTLQEKRGKFLHFRQDEVLLPSGRRTVRDVVLHPGAVAIAALTGEKEILMVRQYRYPAGQVMWEIPAGKLEEGEEPLTTAKRELEEETGFTATEWEELTSFYTAPGFANEIICLFRAEGLKESMAHPDDDEIIEYKKVPLQLAKKMALQGEIRDAKTLIALLWLDRLAK